MVNLKEFNLVREEFFESLDGGSKIDVSVARCKAFKTRFFEKNFFLDALKDFEEVFVEVESDEVIDISGVGVVNVLVKKDCNLLLNFSSKSSCLVRVVVEKGVRCVLSEVCGCLDLFKYLQVFCCEGSSLVLSEFVFGCRFSFSKVFLKREASCDFSLGFLCDSGNFFLRNEVVCLEERCESVQRLTGAVVNSGRVVCDGVIRICEGARSSSGDLRISGLILDEGSKVLAEPILEVLNNFVVCSHSCSIAQVADDVKFYLMSRGVGEEEVLRLVVEGFFELPLSRVENFRQRLFVEERIKF